MTPSAPPEANGSALQPCIPLDARVYASAEGAWPSAYHPGIFRPVTSIPHPDFRAARFASAPDARFVPAPADGVLPEDFFSTTNLPTYVRVRGEWRLPREPRMDSALVLGRDGELWVREMRRVRAGDLIAVGRKEDGSEGI